MSWHSLLLSVGGTWFHRIFQLNDLSPSIFWYVHHLDVALLDSDFVLFWPGLNSWAPDHIINEVRTLINNRIPLIRLELWEAYIELFGSRTYFETLTSSHGTNFEKLVPLNWMSCIGNWCGRQALASPNSCYILFSFCISSNFHISMHSKIDLPTFPGQQNFV